LGVAVGRFGLCYGPFWLYDGPFWTTQRAVLDNFLGIKIFWGRFGDGPFWYSPFSTTPVPLITLCFQKIYPVHFTAALTC